MNPGFKPFTVLLLLDLFGYLRGAFAFVVLFKQTQHLYYKDWSNYVHLRVVEQSLQWSWNNCLCD